MKKILLSLLAVTALASCSKMDVVYDESTEIGFKAVAGNITKAPVDGTVFPEGLNLYIYAQTTDKTDGSANYINDGEFAHKKTTDSKKLWGGTPSPYYWPNVHKLNFAGYSKSGNVAEAISGTKATVGYSFADASGLTITNYIAGSATAEGANDLMWFGNTAKTEDGENGYGKDTPYVPVNMYHTCSWITFLIKGDAGTSGTTITGMKITGIDNQADVICYNVKPAEGDIIQWSNNETTDNTGKKTDECSINITSNLTLGTTARNVETGLLSSNTGGNIVVIPQLPGSISITYQGTNANVAPETVTASLSLDLDADGKQTEPSTAWLPGKHYIYTITIKANEILVAPTPEDWTDYTPNPNVTVE